MMAHRAEFPSWIASDQLRPPAPNESVITRCHLCESIDAERSRSAIFLTAPAGFGKTTLLVQLCDYITAKQETVSWLSLTEEARSVKTFAAMLVLSCANAGIDMAHVFKGAQEGFPTASLSTIAHQISRQLGNAPKCTVVIDDYQSAQCAEVDAFLADLIGKLPAHARMVISSRETIGGRLLGHMAAGNACEFDVSTLCLNQSDISVIFGSCANDPMVDSIFQKTEGWPIAVQLARILIQSKHQPGLDLDSVRGDHNYLAAYLAEQVIADVPQECLELLINTSIVDTFDVSLANQLCGTKHSAAVLSDLNWLRPLLGCDGGDAVRYRFHPLFREYLLKLAKEAGENKIQHLHALASAWYEDKLYITEAVRHAGLAGDYHRCAQLIEQAGGWRLVIYGGTGMLRRLLANLPTNTLSKYPLIELARAYLMARDGHVAQAEALLSTIQIEGPEANTHWQVSTDSDRHHTVTDPLVVEYRAVALQVLEYADRLTNQDGLNRIAQYEAEADPNDFAFHGVLGAAGTLICTGLGDMARAKRYAASGLVAMRRAESVLGLNFLYLHVGYCGFLTGDTSHARANFEEAKRIADENYGSDSNLKFIATIYDEGLKCWMGERWCGADGRGTFASAILDNRHSDGWFESFAMGLTCQLHEYIDAGNIEEASHFLQKCETLAMGRDIERKKMLVQSGQLLLAIAAGDVYGIERLIKELEARLPFGIWREKPEIWRPYFEAYIAIAQHREHTRPAAAMEILQDVVALTECVGAVPLRVSALVHLSLLHAKCGRQHLAEVSVRTAINLAARANLKGPFLIKNERLTSLIDTTLARSDDDQLGSLSHLFIRRCRDASRNRRLANVPQTAHDLLTPREYDVIIALSDGLSNKLIARRLNMTPHTVKFHLRNVFDKLKVANRAQAIVEAQRQHILRA